MPAEGRRIRAALDVGATIYLEPDVYRDDYTSEGPATL